MPQNGTFIECWPHALLSVGLARLSLSLSSFFSCSGLYNNALTGTIPPQISALTKLTKLYALLSVGLARLFLSLSRGLYFYLQGALAQRFDWDDPSSNISASEAGLAVSPHFFFMKCWSDHFGICVFMSVGLLRLSLTFFKRSAFIYRDLSGNKLDGTIPAAIWTLVKLGRLCAHTFLI